ncbi:gamma-glutamylmethylamide synthetase [Paracoccus aminovorans]|uniref:Gamma-glutamylmethylamide synthetase n=1 Tax=Paracoccus aminovorans TaxID=34004 RepID=A0A1I3DME6_9RHOB|nr:type III glutamate--ammonia ligase [Paracoccus aminovorans]CQR83897.1 glutamate-methylamine ligase, gamma-glutamylmethylamide synthetase [Paracoccus aminovorans]SFH87749.1 gamma-glutamylmethylamide synthetase [Paracoccus aminovorans]
MTDLAEFAREKGVKYFMVSYTDLVGAQRAKLVPTYMINNVVSGGAGFAGFAGGFVLTPAHPDMLGMPDADTVIQLPWKPEVAWVAANPAMYDSPLPQAPRNVLRNVIAEMEKEGLRIKTGVEPEFFFLTPEGDRIADTRDTAAKPCYDQQAIMRRYDVISEVSDYMIELGWEPYQSDHEDANGQFEMNWKYDDSLATADKLAFFKFMMKSVAEKHGLRVTFMPKPFLELTGSGMHAHISGWSLDGKTNAFYDGNDELGLSEVGHHFLGGIMKHASALAAITNPTINSYKRINAPRSSSGATWAPNSVTWSGDNRTHLVRVPGKGRIELRLPDGASNPYLLHAVIMAAGLDGIRHKCDPGKRLDIDMYADGHMVKDAPKLPLNLLDAIRAFDQNTELKAALGEEFSASFIEMKMKEWNAYASHLTQWERDHTLDI